MHHEKIYTYTVCRRVSSSFSPAILQAGAVKGLMVCGEFNVRIGEWDFLTADETDLLGN